MSTSTVAPATAPAHTTHTVDSIDRVATPAPVAVTTTTEVIDSSIPLYSRPASSTSTVEQPALADAEVTTPITPYATAVASANPFEGANATVLPPPPYTPDYPAPQYSEPRTFAQDLFYFGFIFPLFWIVGALIMLIALKPVPEELCGKSLEEQSAQLAIVRKVELKWARRCRNAFCMLLLVIGVIIGALAMMRIGVFARR